MKRLFALIFAMCLLLCGCATDDPLATMDRITVPSTEETTEATTEATEATTVPPVVYVNPMTGEELDAPYTGRATTVVIGNTKTALPHHGISEADICYEIESEGGITRIMAVFSQIENVEKIGPVRSARTYFNNVTLAYDGTIVHCGGSVRGRNAGYDDKGKIEDWNHLDQVSNGSYFYRDSDRKSAGYAQEHTLFATGEKLVAGIGAKGFRTSSEGEVSYGLQFGENVALNGEAAKEVIISFRGKKTTTMTYDEATGLYGMSQYGKQTVDGNDDKQVTFKNVIVLYTDQWNIHDGSYSRSYYTLVGSGEGYFAVNGQIVPIKWSREDLNGPFSYTLADGTPITLGVGRTYVAVASVKSKTVEYK